MEVNDAVGATDAVLVSVKEGYEALDGTKNQLEKIFTIINETNVGIVETINGITTQDGHIAKVVRSVESINTVIEQSSSTAEELSSSTEEMASTLEELGAGAEELNSVATNLFDEIKKI